MSPRIGPVVLTLLLHSALVHAQSGDKPPATDPTVPLSAVVRDELDTKVDQALDKLISCEIKEMQLREFCDWFGAQIGIPIQFPLDVKFEAENKINLTVESHPARQVLGFATEQCRCNYIIRHGLLIISSETDRLTIVVYDVTDLVTNEQFSIPDFDSLIQLVTGSVTPTAWTDVGGQCSLRRYSANNRHLLIVSNGRAGHQEISQLLAAMRKVAKLNVDAVNKPAANSSSNNNPFNVKLPPLPFHVNRDVLVADQIRFTLNLYARASQHNKNNLVVSPLGISSVLGMLLSGATDETAAELKRLIAPSVSAGDEDNAYASLLDSLMSVNVRDRKHITLANGLWIQNDKSILDTYQDELRNSYRAEVRLVDFRRADAATRTINDWVRKYTTGKIDQIIKPDDLANDIQFVVTNAVHFENDWAVPFIQGMSSNKPFYSSRGQTTAKLMQLLDKHRYAEFAEVQLLEKPFQGDRVSLFVLLPRVADPHQPTDEEFTKLEQLLTVDNLQRWLTATERKLVEVTLPKIDFTSDWDVKTTLREIGIQRIFSPTESQLGGISERQPLYVSEMVQKARLTMDERGATASAATASLGGMGGFMSGIQDKPVEFRADRPFMFLIRENRTGTILFMGRFVSPKSDTTND